MCMRRVKMGMLSPEMSVEQLIITLSRSLKNGRIVLYVENGLML